MVYTLQIHIQHLIKKITGDEYWVKRPFGRQKGIVLKYIKNTWDVREQFIFLKTPSKIDFLLTRTAVQLDAIFKYATTGNFFKER